MNFIIESHQNPKVKQLIRWREKPAARRKEGIAIVEGSREIERALTSGWKMRECYTKADAHFSHDKMNLRPMPCSEDIFEQIAVRTRGVDVLAVFEVPSIGLSDVILPERPLILILDNLEKPGNVGAILRSADAAVVDLVIGSSLQCDPFCPEVVRNSLGGIFHTPFVVSERDYVQAWLADHRWPVYQLHLSGQRSPQEVDLTQSAVLVMGAEDKGLDGSWSMLKGDRIKLPMRGLVDSLNVSVTAGIVLFEAVRQRATSVAE